MQSTVNMAKNHGLGIKGPKTESTDVFLMITLLLCNLNIHVYNYNFLLLSTLEKEVYSCSWLWVSQRLTTVQKLLRTSNCVRLWQLPFHHG